MESYWIEFTTKDGYPGRIRLPNPQRVGTFVYHALKLGDTITKIARVQ